MKSRFFKIFLILVLGFSAAACDETSPAGWDEDEVPAEESGDSEEAAIPEAVLNLSDEDNKKLTGVLTADDYSNEYFGIKLVKPEGGSISSLFDDEGVTDIKTFKETYETGLYGINIQIHREDGIVPVSILVSTIPESEKGMSEEEIIQDYIETEIKINEGMGNDAEITKETIVIAGKEHPAMVECFSDGETDLKTVSVYMIKNDFECLISIYTPAEELDSALELVKKY